MNVAIVGCGQIGHKRQTALGDSNRLVIAADNLLSRAEALVAKSPGAVATDDWLCAATHPEVDVVIVSTTNDWLTPVTLAAVKAGKHVLVEKPAARCAEELREVSVEVNHHRVCVWVGFNHRYHPAFQEARKMVDSGALGPLMFVRGRYGHGGRLGYEQEWRANPEISGGGELLDQGVHLIDLASWFLGRFKDVIGYVQTYFWDMPVEDNGFLLLRTERGQAAWLHASCTEWKNLFCFEIYGKEGKLQIDGLGGSYGDERLTFYKVLPQMGPPETTVWEFPGGDLSWQREFAAFAELIRSGVFTAQSLENAAATLEIVRSLYRDGLAIAPTQLSDEQTLKL
ncbi:MAG TPA: Gfo/Idh/MocA family oxidoreductase [Terriglobales bacterium]|nr:Gfo/Idh/MocA family oxidoreductase [Terriglobales bacterium]